jgi:hypothetical protein
VLVLYYTVNSISFYFVRGAAKHQKHKTKCSRIFAERRCAPKCVGFVGHAESVLFCEWRNRCFVSVSMLLFPLQRFFDLVGSVWGIMLVC